MTINELVTEELREAWLFFRETSKVLPPHWTEVKRRTAAHDAIRDLLAALLESEFQREHVVKEHDSLITGKYLMCGICPMELDPRHNCQWSDWQAAAEKVIEAK